MAGIRIGSSGWALALARWIRWNPSYAQQAQPDGYALWQQRIRHRQPVIVQVV